jgi:hypothetical protein
LIILVIWLTFCKQENLEAVEGICIPDE